jgi:large subunit ribosomal protein L24
MAKLNPKLIHVPKHKRDQMIGATLSDNLRSQYKKRGVRVIEGDSVKILRGEYAGVEGKVEKVHTITGTLEIEGVQKQKIKGGQVKVPVNASNVMITGLNLDDKQRAGRLARSAPTPAKKKAEGK